MNVSLHFCYECGKMLNYADLKNHLEMKLAYTNTALVCHYYYLS